MKNISLEVSEFPNSTESAGCSYSFIVKDGSYKFSLAHLDGFSSEELPLILDWSVGSENCAVSKVEDDYACKNNSVCYDKDIDIGYQCKCKKGYEGNPYHPDGCKDIDECKTNNTCITKEHCHNTEGKYECLCPDGKPENGIFAGGCQDHRQPDLIIKIAIGSSSGFAILLLGISSLYLIYQKRKLVKLKQKFFQQNGGFILLQQLSTREDTSQSAQIFTEKELKKATNNYDESLIIGRGGFELLTGDKPIYFNRSEENTSLAMHFLSCLNQDRIFEAIQVGILNDENKNEIKEVAILAARCLSLRGDERPSMKEVAMELDSIRLIEKHPWNDTELNLESQRLLHEASCSIYIETGDNSDLRYTTGYDSLKDQPLLALDGGR
ncbi:putative wall-associated receptor kinase [Trifolium repens]|nr:putative wall-associated receptor kinase [Trifolium repens]